MGADGAPRAGRAAPGAEEARLAVVALGLLVVMGILTGGMTALALIGPRRLENIFGIGALAGIAGGVFGAVIGPNGLTPLVLPTLVNDALDFTLALFIGYAVTTFFVLSRRRDPDAPLPEIQRALAGPGKTAVIYFAPAESEAYDPRVAAQGFETADYPQALPPTLLRPLYLRDLKRKYAAVGRDPDRAAHFKLAQKVQDRLGKRYRVYIAFYNDQPALRDVATEALREGSQRLIVLHARLTNPPPQVRPAELLAPLRLARYGATLLETAPLWNSDLLPRLFVRRALAATEGADRAQVGLLLVGTGHPLPRRGQPDSPAQQRQHQEMAFQKRVRLALIRAGFADDKVTLGWLRWQHPRLPAAAAQLAAEGCARIYWIASGLVTDGLTTLHDIPAQLRPAGAATGVEISGLGAWGDEDVVAEAMVERVKQVAGA
jgi:protoheme ferro-lyase